MCSAGTIYGTWDERHFSGLHITRTHSVGEYLSYGPENALRDSAPYPTLVRIIIVPEVSGLQQTTRLSQNAVLTNLYKIFLTHTRESGAKIVGCSRLRDLSNGPLLVGKMANYDGLR